MPRKGKKKAPKLVSSTSRVVGVGDFNGTLHTLLREYGDQVKYVLDDEVEYATKEAAKRLRQKKKFSPTYKRKATGEYAKDWTSKVDHSQTLYEEGIVYNKDHYQLPHLLEFGHAVYGGRTERYYDDAPAYPHIAPVEKEVSEELMANVRRRLGD